MTTVQGRHCLTPDEASHYLYFVLPPELRARARAGLWLEVEYFGDRFAQFRVQYASTDRGAEVEGLYKPAQQRWDGDAVGLSRFNGIHYRNPELIQAGTLMTMIIPVVAFLLTSRFFTRGIVITGVEK